MKKIKYAGPLLCDASIWDTSRGEPISRSCLREAVQDGYCKQHHPDAQKKRWDEKASKKREAKCPKCAKYGNALANIRHLEEEVERLRRLLAASESRAGS